MIEQELGTGGRSGRADHPLRPDGSLLFDPEQLRRLVPWLQRTVREQRSRNGGAPTGVLVDFIAALGESLRLQEVLGPQEVPHAEPPVDGSGSVLITAKDAAAVMGCSPGYVRRLARLGRVAGSRVGRDWLIDADRIDRPRPPRRAA